MQCTILHMKERVEIDEFFVYGHNIGYELSCVAPFEATLVFYVNTPCLLA